MKIKSLAFLALSLILLFTFAACDNSSDNGESSHNETTSSVHTHSFEEGYCECGEVNISNTNLNGCSYTYAYFKMHWSSSATEQEKENLRIAYGEEDDEKLFEKIESEYRQLITIFGSFMIDKYVFNENEVSIYKGDSLYKTVSYSIENNQNILIDGDLFWYGNGIIYSTGDSEDLRGVAIKTVFSKN